mmetsp:Transcript_41792/g.82208  ORF Transcript_41792/g.82208 Transcript_41792/m.82208 type:complete len:327 (-) Transcript_41792:531-1511(-)
MAHFTSSAATDSSRASSPPRPCPSPSTAFTLPPFPFALEAAAAAANRSRTNNPASSEVITSHNPSHAIKRNSSPGCSLVSVISGQLDTNGFGGFLKSASPRALETASCPFTRLLFTNPPRCTTRATSSGRSARQSNVRSRAQKDEDEDSVRPPPPAVAEATPQRMARQSPRFAHTSLSIPSNSTTHAVHPAPVCASSGSPKNRASTLKKALQSASRQPQPSARESSTAPGTSASENSAHASPAWPSNRPNSAHASANCEGTFTPCRRRHRSSMVRRLPCPPACATSNPNADPEAGRVVGTGSHGVLAASHGVSSAPGDLKRSRREW